MSQRKDRNPILTDVQLPHRDDYAAIIRELLTISSPDAVSTSERLDVNGASQWIEIRGRRRSNPALLFIHGGPGTPLSHMSWAFQSPLEDFFTIVNWDQRGVGKNATNADHASLESTVSLKLLIDDAETVSEHICKSLNHERLIVMGYSYGSYIGAHLAAKRPDIVRCYIGLCQATGPESEKIIYEETLKRAVKAGNKNAIDALNMMAPFTPGNRAPTRDQKLELRQWAAHFDGCWTGKQDLELLYKLPYLCPHYSDADIAAWVEAMNWFSEALAESSNNKEGMQQLSPPTHFQTDVAIFAGKMDLMTPYSAAKKYFDSITAPNKSFVTFQNSAHFPFFEEPGRFIKEILNIIE